MKKPHPFPYARLKLVVGDKVLQNVTLPKKDVSAKVHFWKTVFSERGSRVYVDIKPMRTFVTE